jgi:methionine biosynthesis protein MetW
MANAFVRRKYKIVANFIEPGSTVLDVGCDTGELAEFLPKVKYSGLEVDKDRIKELRQKKVQVFEKDLNDKTLSLGKKFDYIVMLDLLEHLLNPARVIKDLKKHLIKGGKMIIVLPNDYHLLNKFRFLANRNLTEKPFWEYGHLHIFPIKQGKAFLHENGLKIINSAVLYPEKPTVIPNFIKRLLAKASPNNFSRGVLYLTEPQ